MILHLLANDGFLTVNKSIAKMYGLNVAVMIAELASLALYWESNDGLDADGMFYATAECIEDDTTLSRYQQTQAIKAMVKNGILTVKRKGVPAKQFFRLNEQILADRLKNKSSKNFKTGVEKTLKQDFKKLEVNNNKEKRIEKKNREVSNPVLKRKVIPPLKEWVEDYCKERGGIVDADRFYDFYESKGWLVGKSKMKDWQAAVRTWERSRKESPPRYRNQHDELAKAWQELEVEQNERDHGWQGTGDGEAKAYYQNG